MIKRGILLLIAFSLIIISAHAEDCSKKGIAVCGENLYCSSDAEKIESIMGNDYCNCEAHPLTNFFNSCKNRFLELFK